MSGTGEKGIRVLVTRRFLPEDLEYLRARLDPGVEVVVPDAFTEEAILAAAGGVDVLLGTHVSRPLLERHAAHLRLILVPWTGVDTVDFALVREFKVPVANSHSNAFFVAEHAVALLLAIARDIPGHDRDLRRGRWRRPGRAESGFTPPVTLAGANILIAGYGAIGAAVASLLAPFGATLAAIRNHPAATPPSPLHVLRGPDARLDLAGDADAVILTLPLTGETRNFVDQAFLARMKSEAYLVNVGRGELIAEEPLYEALKTGRIAGAALDTWYDYPTASQPETFPSHRYPFHELDNVVMSPHRAGFVRGRLPHLDDAADNLNRLASGLAPRNLVDLDRGY